MGKAGDGERPTRGAAAQGGQQVTAPPKPARPERPTTTFSVVLPILTTILAGRVCSRCNGAKFAALAGNPVQYRAVCDRFLDEKHTDYCGALIGNVYNQAGELTAVHCGDWRDDTEVCDEQSPASLPLAVCLECGRLCRLI
jgi:hypothetical protein